MEHPSAALGPEMFGQWLRIAVVADGGIKRVSHCLNGGLVAGRQADDLAPLWRPLPPCGKYQNSLDCFARCLLAGVPPKPDAAEGIVTVALMQAMDEAAASGQPVKVRDVLARHQLSRLFPR